MTRVPAVTADRRGLAGDRGFIDTGDALDDFAIGRDEIARFHQHDVAGAKLACRHLLQMAIFQPFGAKLRLGCAERGRLRLAASLRQRLGERSKKHRQPQPHSKLQLEADA